MDTVTADNVVKLLTDYGCAEADVTAAIDSLRESGLEAAQPDDHTVLTMNEVAVILRQLEVAVD
jgi:hypothetical protein